MPSQTETNLTLAADTDPRFLWNQIVRWTFEACILRKEGREAEVCELLQARLPGLIRAWSSRSGLHAEESKRQLKSLFQRAQETVEYGTVQRRMIVEEVCSRLSKAGASATARLDPKGPVQLRRRVPIGNIPDMLDALAEAESEALADAVLPLRSAVAPAPNPFSEEPSAQATLCA